MAKGKPLSAAHKLAIKWGLEKYHKTGKTSKHRAKMAKASRDYAAKK